MIIFSGCGENVEMTKRTYGELPADQFMCCSYLTELQMQNAFFSQFHSISTQMALWNDVIHLVKSFAFLKKILSLHQSAWCWTNNNILSVFFWTNLTIFQNSHFSLCEKIKHQKKLNLIPFFPLLVLLTSITMLVIVRKGNEEGLFFYLQSRKNKE